jgi:hypothetical protein
LFPGFHFDRLATFLREPFRNHAKPPPVRSRVPIFDFVIIYILDGGTIKPYRPSRPADLLKDAETQACRLVFLRGKPCPEWLAYTGAAYHIDPEFFGRHLDYLSRIGRKNYYNQPSLLSTSRRIVQLSYMTIGESNQHKIEKQEYLDALRSDSDKAMLNYFSTLVKSMTMNSPHFESIVRSHHVLDTEHFAIEQQISICFTPSGRGWTGWYTILS